jgi:putative YphP/YqiW family bacilliredoxin
MLRVRTSFFGFRRAGHSSDGARSYFTGYPPSSPSIAILRDGKLLYMMQRSNIERSDPAAIASELKRAFEQFCGTPAL